jgi:ribosome-associated protein
MEIKKKRRSVLSAQDKAQLIIQTALQKKPMNPIGLQVEGICSFTEYFLILSGNSTRQTQALADHLRTALGKKGLRPLGVEGEEAGQWILMDYDEVVVHIFLDSIREFYDVEGLWIDAPRVDLPVEQAPAGSVGEKTED